jgi:copper chaperone CopZ
MTGEQSIRAVSRELNVLPINVLKIEMGRAEVAYDMNKITRKQIELAIKDAGYKVIG